MTIDYKLSVLARASRSSYTEKKMKGILNLVLNYAFAI